MTSTPNSIFSWNSTLNDGKNHAELVFNWMSEQGSISINRKYYQVNKHGIFSGKWTLSDHSGALVTAEKFSAFTRKFILNGPSGTHTLEAQSMFGRAMSLHGSSSHALITPQSIFTRKATITGHTPDFETTSFAMWLTLMTWRRSSGNGNANGASH